MFTPPYAAPCSYFLTTFFFLKSPDLLCSDNFFIKYVDALDLHHLLDALQTMYIILIDWEAKLYSEIKLQQTDM